MTVMTITGWITISRLILLRIWRNLLRC